MGKSTRGRRVNEIIREVLAEAVQRDLSDPRLGFLTITTVDANRDVSAATVYFTTLTDDQREGTEAALASAAGLLQSRVAGALRTKNTPQLTFVYDDLTERAEHLTRLIDEVTDDQEGE